MSGDGAPQDDECVDGGSPIQKIPSPPGSEANRRRKSVLGASLGRRVGQTAVATKDAAREIGTASPSPLSTSQKIAQRYASEVREADRNRKDHFRPLDQTLDVRPLGIDVAREMKRDMVSIATQSGGRAVGWDALLTNETFQKRMQFLHEHARTGHFIEQYGVDGCYEGQFLHGMRHGKGTHEFRNEVYEGEWKWDHRHGWGQLNNGDGSAIKGEWQAGKPHGFASILDTKGVVVYEGEFKDGKRHGLGRQLFDSGDMYDGGWSEGRLHDRGVYYFTNGDKLYGMWKDGVYDGIGVFHYADGSISRRVYKDGLLMSVQDYEHATQRFGKTLTREGMRKHTRDTDFPKEVFLLSSV